MQNKKGQSFMDFLMTYGWAILAAIIAILVLAFFGIFTPNQGTIKQDICTVSIMTSKVVCQDSGETFLTYNKTQEELDEFMQDCKWFTISNTEQCIGDTLEVRGR